MSFSAKVKNELCHIQAEDICCKAAEIDAAFSAGGKSRSTMGIRYMVTENSAFARRLYSFIREVFNEIPQVSIKKSIKLKKHAIYTLTITKTVSDKVKMLRREKIYTKKCCYRAFLRGAFLAAGSVSDPEKTYHLEIISHLKKEADYLDSIMHGFGLASRIIKRNKAYVIYLKEGENIVDFLNITGAFNALMELENIRILKEMRNGVNRLVNCETANLEKTVVASLKQIADIQFIKEHKGLEFLSDNLYEIAQLRLLNSEASLTELGQMLRNPIGKSGVSHRLKKIQLIADELREKVLDN